MPANFNSVVLAGNCTRDPQVKFLANETAVANFGIAVNRKYKDRDGNMAEEATFVDIEVWGKLAEICGQYLAKGRSCLVHGRLKLDTWEKDGQRHSKLRVVADTVQFLGGKDEDRGEGRQQGQAKPAGRAQRPARDETPGSFDGTPGVPDDEPPF